MTKKTIDGVDFEFKPGPDGLMEVMFQGQKVKIDKNGQLVGAEAFGNKIEKIDGGMKVTRADGVATIMHDDGNVTIENLVPKSVGITSLGDIESYSIRPTDDTLVHRIEFKNGGHVEVTYRSNGDVAGFSGSKINQNISADSEIMISSATSEPTVPSGSVH